MDLEETPVEETHLGETPLKGTGLEGTSLKAPLLKETPPPPPPKEMTYNVIKGETGEQLNKEPLTEEAARAFANKIRESDAGISLVIRSNRFFIMEDNVR